MKGRRLRVALIYLSWIIALVQARTPWSVRVITSSPSSNLLPTNSRRQDVKKLLSASLKEENNSFLPRGGADNQVPLSSLDKTIRMAMQVLLTTGRLVLPPVVRVTQTVLQFYVALPKDLIIAQAGLVYCFAGGYFPTLFAAIQAAEQCGWEIMVQAIDDLASEGSAAIRACDSTGWFTNEQQSSRQLILEKTKIVLQTIDPVKINQAMAALYTTWMGVSTVLEREFARTITLSISIADCIRPTANFLFAPIAYRLVANEYHQWVPVILGWGCKAAAMSVAWRIQRVLTAYSSAIAGGLLFSRSIFRWLRKRGFRFFGIIPEDCSKSSIDEIFGILLAALGLYSQIGNGFSFTIPFPLNLVTWPFELAERWIEWQITKES